jgi:hypothetical protein
MVVAGGPVGPPDQASPPECGGIPASERTMAAEIRRQAVKVRSRLIGADPEGSFERRIIVKTIRAHNGQTVSPRRKTP